MSGYFSSSKMFLAVVGSLAVVVTLTYAADPSRCHYYCVYRHSAYCCDDGSLPMAKDHDVNEGRCPLMSEQVCKNETVMLHIKAHKVAKTSDGGSHLGVIGSGAVQCASDGYCGADSKCCVSACAKRHVCLRALHPRKWKPSSVEKPQGRPGKIFVKA